MPDTSSPNLVERIAGSLYGGAIGDALGAPPEGKDPEEIKERYGEILDFVEPWDGPSDIGKGDGRHTDDTHMIRLLSEIYIEQDKRLDVYDFARIMPGRIADEPRFIAEYGREATLLERLFFPEKWVYIRNALANAEPRSAGAGNMVNCGAAMYAAPVGIVNAGNPDLAYRDAIDIFSAHQTSFGLEAAGLMAVAVAAAFIPGISIGELFDVVEERAHEGTRNCLTAVRQAVRGVSDWRWGISVVRKAIAPYDTAPEVFRDRGNGTNDWTPSREHSIEEVPAALGLLLVTDGDFVSAVQASANYGRDCDSTAGMAGSIAGAMAPDTVPEHWHRTVAEANRMDLDSLARGLADLTLKLAQAEAQHAVEVNNRLTAMA